MEQTTSPTMVPRGNGGAGGHILRMIACVCTGGFAFPNTFVEGMDLTAIQNKAEGVLYAKDKKGSNSKARF
jgi:hypothetical protein